MSDLSCTSALRIGVHCGTSGFSEDWRQTYIPELGDPSHQSALGTMLESKRQQRLVQIEQRCGH